MTKMEALCKKLPTKKADYFHGEQSFSCALFKQEPLAGKAQDWKRDLRGTLALALAYDFKNPPPLAAPVSVTKTRTAYGSTARLWFINGF